MPMTTYLMEREGLGPTMLPDLDDLLVEVRQKTGEDWRVLERDVRVRRHGFLWRKRTVERCYQLLVGVGGGEFQVINFWQPWSHDWSINDLVQPALVMAYLYGVLSGAATPSRDGVLLANREALADLVVREACETEPADPDDPEVIKIRTYDLRWAALAAMHAAAPLSSEKR